MKVQGVLKRASLDYEGEQSIMVELKLHDAEAVTYKRESIKFTAAADIDIGGNDTMRIVIEGKGKALNFDSRFSDELSKQERDNVDRPSGSTHSGTLGRGIRGLVRVITFGKAK